MKIDTGANILPIGEAMFAEATWWHFAARILYAYSTTETTLPELPGVSAVPPKGAVPMLAVCGPVEAFGIELYFKAALHAAGTPERGHLLLALFRKLDATLQADIRDRYGKWRGENRGWDVWWASNGQSTEFDDILSDSSAAFPQMRYMAENSRNPTSPTSEFNFLAMPISEATRDALVSKYPHWAKHTALHGSRTTFRTH